MASDTPKTTDHADWKIISAGRELSYPTLRLYMALAAFWVLGFLAGRLF